MAKELFQQQARARNIYLTKVLGQKNLPYPEGHRYGSLFERLPFRAFEVGVLQRYSGTIYGAAQANDEEFLINLGKALQDPPLSEMPQNLPERMLVDGRTNTELGHPPLCLFTDFALADCLQLAANYPEPDGREWDQNEDRLSVQHAHSNAKAHE